MRRILHAELRKLRYTRSLAAIPVLGVTVSLLAAVVLVAWMDGSEIAAELSQHGPLRFGPTNVGLVLGIFGIRLLTDETHHHTLATTFVASPRRSAVLAGKAIVGAACAVAVCTVIYALVVPLTLVAIDSRGLPMSNDLAATFALFGRVTAAMTLVTLLAVGFAAVVRNRAIALVTAVLWLALAEHAVGSLLHIEQYLPATLVRTLIDGHRADGLGAPWAAAALGAYVLAAFAAAIPSLRRDIA